MAQFTVYKSTDTSAPVLHSNADANNLIALLDAVLVNGYGSKAAAGWSHPFTGSGTHQAYRSGSGNRFYFDILDDGALTGARRNTQVFGYLSMSAIGVGTGAFPNTAQVNLGNPINWRKSTDISSTARPWTIYADDRTVYIFIQTGDTGGTSGNYPLYAFGEFYSYAPNDMYNCLLIGVATTVSSSNFTTTSTIYDGDRVLANIQSTPQVGHYKARCSTGFNTSFNFYKKGGNHLLATPAANGALLGILTYLNTSDGDLYLHPIWIMDGNTVTTVPEAIHGEFRGLYHQCHPISNFTDGDTCSGAASSSFAGKTFVFLKQTPNGGIWTIETSNTLRTN